MPPPRRPSRAPLTRASLPAELTAETLRHIGLSTLGQFARRDNGVLDADEQRQFDKALAELRRGAQSLVEESLRRARRREPGSLDPGLRRSYARAQQRLATQAEHAGRRLPELGPDPAPEPDAPSEPPTTVDEPAAETTDDVSQDALEQQVEQTSETLDMLERIASLQQQLLDHQQNQLLSETRGLFFAFLVSVAVIVAGVAPLVEADSRDRLLTVFWTVAAIVLAAVAYAVVRWAQARK